jgi:DNA ligase-1
MSSAGKLAGMTVALTGKLSKSKEEYGRIIAAHGGTLSNTVTKKTTHVIAADPNAATDKLEKARKNGAQVCDERFLLELGGDERLQIGSAPGPTATKMAAPPEVLLAESYEPDRNGDMVGWWCSEKLDGVRSWWDGKNFWSRTGNLFHAPDSYKAQMPLNCILDGELFIGRQKFKETVSIVKSHSHKNWDKIVFMVFDIPSQGQLPFEQRQALIREMCNAHVGPMKFVEQRQIQCGDNIAKMLADVEGLGGEGLMFREPGSKYVGKRSRTLVKMKSFIDEEARVIGYATEGKGRLAGTVGSLLVEDAQHVSFQVGSGLDDETRRNPPPIGSLITFRYQERMASTRKPRFPVFVGIAIDK